MNYDIKMHSLSQQEALSRPELSKEYFFASSYHNLYSLKARAKDSSITFF